MYRMLVIIMCLVLVSVVMIGAQETGPAGPVASAAPDELEAAGDPDAKLVGGMSILGNKEAPMSLFIVPWKASELGAEANLTRTLNERRMPVDRDVFLRELAFYEVSASARTTAPATAVSLLRRH